MEEYKRIAKLIFVPSFACLLPAASVILLAYTYFLDFGNYITGISCLSFSLVVMVFYLRKISDISSVENIILHISIPVIVSIVLVIRIFFICDYIPVDGGITKFFASIESVKMLRYSNEVKLRFSGCQVAGKDIIANKAVSYTGKDIIPDPGDEILITGRPEEIKYDPKQVSSFGISLLREGIHYSFYLNKNYTVIRKAPEKFRDKVRKAVDGNICRLFDKKTVPVIRGLYFANGNYVDKSTAADFRRAGVLHILAASGEHVGVIAGAFLFLLSPVFISRKILHVIISVILLFYLYITDMPVSLLRAFVMYYIFSIQYIFDFEKNIFNTLFLSALVILTWHPYELFSLGFQLSFGATFGIVLFGRFYRNILYFIPAKISTAMSATFAAQIFVFPVIFAGLGEINLTGLVSNVILIFTMSATLILSIAANIISLVWLSAGRFFAEATDITYSISLGIIRYFSDLKGHFVSACGGLMLIPYFMFALPVIPVIKSRKIMMASLLASMACAWFILSHDLPSGKKIAVLNSDDNAIILMRENDNPVVFGTLHKIENAEIIAKYLNTGNSGNIKLCIPSPDYSNLRGFMHLIKKTIVSECYISRGFYFSNYLQRFCGIIDTDGIRLNIVDFQKEGAIEETSGFNPLRLRDILDSPFENISEIYCLLTEKYNYRDLVIEEMIDCGYTVEYLE